MSSTGVYPPRISCPLQAARPSRRRGAPSASTRGSAPRRLSSAMPPGQSRWVDSVSDGNRARSIATTRRPARASAIAAAEPAQRAPTTTASTCSALGSADIERIGSALLEQLAVGRLRRLELGRVVQLVHAWRAPPSSRPRPGAPRRPRGRSRSRPPSWPGRCRSGRSPRTGTGWAPSCGAWGASPTTPRCSRAAAWRSSCGRRAGSHCTPGSRNQEWRTPSGRYTSPRSSRCAFICAHTSRGHLGAGSSASRACSYRIPGVSQSEMSTERQSTTEPSPYSLGKLRSAQN